ncbi:MAG: tetratricopeptide repeat protein [Candidatus Delongbacteria bacterium]|nr:tetratricopeptide repeat protein [Candidatus Delongbacteria bacterium]MBN2833922.1 tetratricopeptide repeat protein [Candidatus Delongbacteria bacterium]
MNNEMKEFIYKNSISDLTIFSHLVVHIKTIMSITISNTRKSLYLYLIKDIYSGFLFTGVSTEKASDSILLFCNYAISNLTHMNIKVNAIITSGNKLFVSINNTELSDFIDNIITISNSDRSFDKIFKQDYQKLILKEDFSTMDAFISHVSTNNTLLNVKCLQENSDKRYLKRFYRSLPQIFTINIDSKLCDLPIIVLDRNYWKVEEDKSREKYYQIVGQFLKYCDQMQDFGDFDEKLWLLDIITEISLFLEDKNKINSEVYLRKGMISFRKGEGIEAKKLYKKAVDFAEKSSDNILIGTTYYFYGDQLFQNGKRKQAADYFQKALDIFTSVNDYRRSAVVFGLFSTLMNENKQYSKAIDYIKKMLDCARLTNDELQISVAYNKLANTYRNMGETEKALEIYNDRLSYAILNNDKYLICTCLGNISNIFVDKGNFDLAMAHHNELLKTAMEIDHKILLGKAISGKGNIYLLLKDYDNSLKQYQESLKIFTNLNIKTEIFNCLIKLGDLFKLKGNKLLTKNNYVKAIDIANEIGDRNLINISLERMKKRLK